MLPFPSGMSAEEIAALPPEVMASMLHGAPPPVVAMFQSMMGDMPAMPAHARGGYDFMTNVAGKADDVAELEQCDEWWVLMLADEMEDEDEPTAPHISARVQVMQHDSKKNRLESHMIIAHCLGDYRATHFTGECELLWRTLLTACDGPLSHMPGGAGSIGAGLDAALGELAATSPQASILRLSPHSPACWLAAVASAVVLLSGGPFFHLSKTPTTQDKK